MKDSGGGQPAPQNPPVSLTEPLQNLLLCSRAAAGAYNGAGAEDVLHHSSDGAEPEVDATNPPEMIASALVRPSGEHISEMTYRT